MDVFGPVRPFSSLSPSPGPLGGCPMPFLLSSRPVLHLCEAPEPMLPWSRTCGARGILGREAAHLAPARNCRHLFWHRLPSHDSLSHPAPAESDSTIQPPYSVHSDCKLPAPAFPIREGVRVLNTFVPAQLPIHSNHDGAERTRRPGARDRRRIHLDAGRPALQVRGPRLRLPHHRGSFPPPFRRCWDCSLPIGTNPWPQLTSN